MAANAQHEIEVILTKQLASYLAMPIFVVGPEGDLVYFNEPAETLLGRRYDETDDMPMSEWSTIFRPRTDEAMPLRADQVPLVVALHERRPVHDTIWIKSLDGTDRHLSVTAFPLVGQHDRELGAVAMFWETTIP